MTDPTGDIIGISALADPVRRQIYQYVSAQPSPVSREQAAEALGLPRHQAAFQLDRLAEAGLLTTSYVRRSGKAGPGAGRPAKLYQRRTEEIAVSLPERRYALAGEILAAAVDDALHEGQPIEDALARSAIAQGAELARSVLARATPIETAVAAVQQLGYEPRLEDDRVVMANCPFHAVAKQHTVLVCGMNQSLLDGLCGSIGGLSAHLEPAPGRCCVVLRANP